MKTLEIKDYKVWDLFALDNLIGFNLNDKQLLQS